ncbi:MAG: winged helix-turn-helix transcriptional regulator [Candidatus Yanofskybacteria bacterium]|nr:winged helix-turn-helix transcriptional regulator [Candidatus Yanofskybacteria bacterium]
MNKIRRELRSKKALTECACDFSILGDLTRMKICYLLCKYKELSVSEIAEVVGVSISAVSHSLKASRRDFKTVFYRLDKKSPLTGFVRKQAFK